MATPARLSEHFTLKEMVATTHREFLDENSRPPGSVVANLTRVAKELLEPVRAHFKAAVFVHSGYRCPRLNHAIGGSVGSQHLTGAAADFHVDDVDLTAVFDFIAYGGRNREAAFPFGQVILEGWGSNGPTWVHVSLPDPSRDLVDEVLTMSNGRYTRLR